MPFASKKLAKSCAATHIHNVQRPVKGKRCNLGDGEGLQVPCSLDVVGQTKCAKFLRQELMKIKEI